MKKLIDVYPYRLVEGKVQFLVFMRSSKKIYAGQWRMIGGKVKPEETSWQAGLRELMEETGLKPVKFWTIPSVNQFYEHKTDMIHAIPAFAAQIPESAQIDLDDEHTDFKWISANDAAEYLKWPEQQRLIKLVDEILTNDIQEILPEWIIEI